MWFNISTLEVGDNGEDRNIGKIYGMLFIEYG